MALELVEGWTERILDKLWKIDSTTGIASAENLTGMTVQILIYPRGSTTAKTLSGSQYGIVTAASGEVYYDPNAGDLVASESPYKVRWKVTDSGSDIAYFPNGDAEQWIVRKP